RGRRLPDLCRHGVRGPLMRVGDRWYRTIWPGDDGWSVMIIDQTALPAALTVRRLTDVDQVAEAIVTMRVRGAPLIGVTAAYGVALALRSDPGNAAFDSAIRLLAGTRPTAVNLRWALDRVEADIRAHPPEDRAAAAYRLAAAMADDDVEVCRRIGEYGEGLIRERWESLGRSRPVQILTHCNAGWLATVDWGTALAPIYRAHDAGIPVHVWVDETRPRNQGLLTEWELGCHGVPRTVVTDNAGGHLMRTGRVDLCLVGTDRTTRNGDVANKIGTYLKALAAFDNGVPFYVAAPSSSIDWSLADGGAVPIEERAGRELGLSDDIPVMNPAFDVTPARLVTQLVTERGVVAASAPDLAALFPEGSRGSVASGPSSTGRS
ncbi:MAG: S-methyl-5-thioribose-1-phosphate isomerase, partial [Gemmatimonadales bacterium]|nr:S-methyl-5-thioribose-1-phosphate isomerase [Gemmatimonadales bacterium]